MCFETPQTERIQLLCDNLLARQEIQSEHQGTTHKFKTQNKHKQMQILRPT